MNLSDVRIFETAADWEAWLAVHHGTAAGAWLKIAKKGQPHPGIGITDAGDVALCWGWIDSQRNRLDDSFFLQRYTPRRPGAAWSSVNVERAERLIAEGRMRDPGLREIDAAKADGRWTAAYAPQATATAPPDLLQLLEHEPKLKQAFEHVNKTKRYLLMLPLLKARTPAVREKELQAVISKLRAQ